MAWLEGDARNISSGWGPEPKLEAPNIGATLSAILTNRRVQQQQTQEALTAAIKAQQDRNSSAAYIQAAQNAGVLPQGDYSGMTAAEASNLAQRIQDQTPDTDSDNLKAAMAKYYNRLADTGGTPRGGPAGQRPFTQGQQFNALKTQDSVLGKQADELAGQQEDYGLPADVQPPTHGYVMRDGKLDYARTPAEQANPTLVSPGDPITDPNAKTFTPDVYKQRQSQSDALKQILAEQDRVRKQILNPQVSNPQNLSQADIDQANQAPGMPGASAPPPTQPNPPYSQSIPTPTAPPGTQPTVLQLRQQAQDAIAKGADPQAVAKKFNDLTGGQL